MNTVMARNIKQADSWTQRPNQLCLLLVKTWHFPFEVAVRTRKIEGVGEKKTEGKSNNVV